MKALRRLGMHSRNQDNSNEEWEETKSESDEPSVSEKVPPPPPTRKNKGPPLRRAVTIHKPTKIGKILSETMGGRLIDEEQPTSDMDTKSKQKKSKKRLKIEAKYQPAVIKITPAEVIEEVDRDYESGGTLQSPKMKVRDIRRASRFTIPENFESEDDSDEDLELESSFETSNNNQSGQHTSVDRIVLED